MDVSAPIAFAAALIGGALGGFLFAFLPCPGAGIIQWVIRSYGHRYDVVAEASAGDQGGAGNQGGAGDRAVDEGEAGGPGGDPALEPAAQTPTTPPPPPAGG